MKEKLARIYAKRHAEEPPCDACYSNASETLSLIREEIEKELLTDEEILDALLSVYPPNLDEQPEAKQQFIDARREAIAQAQLDKVLKALES